jgi:hypothetical protein
MVGPTAGWPIGGIVVAGGCGRVINYNVLGRRLAGTQHAGRSLQGHAFHPQSRAGSPFNTVA